MTRRGRLKRTISFWQLVRAADGKQVVDADWKQVLSRWARESTSKKIINNIGGYTLGGKIHTVNEIDHLVVTRDRDDLPRQQHRATGEVAEMEVRADDWDVIESSFVSFLDFGNVFGIMQSANTAPSPQAVAKWINATRIFDVSWAAEPVIDREKWNRVRRAGGVSRLEFAGPTSLFSDVGGGPLAHLYGLGEMGQFKVELKINAGRAAGKHEERHRLYEMTEALIRSIGLDRVSKARAKIFDDSDEGIPSETINLLKQRFSRKETVSLLGQDSGARAVSETSAFTAILAVAEDLRNDLRGSVGTE